MGPTLIQFWRLRVPAEFCSSLTSLDLILSPVKFLADYYLRTFVRLFSVFYIFDLQMQNMVSPAKGLILERAPQLIVFLSVHDVHGSNEVAYKHLDLLFSVSNKGIKSD